MENVYKELVTDGGMICDNKEFFISYLSTNTTLSMLKRGRVFFNTVVENNKSQSIPKYSSVYFSDLVYASNANFRLQLALGRVLNSLEHDIKSYINQVYLEMSNRERSAINRLYNNKIIEYTDNTKTKVKYMSIGENNKLIRFSYLSSSQAQSTFKFYDVFEYCTFGELLKMLYYHFDKSNKLIFYSRKSTGELYRHKQFNRSTIWYFNNLRNKISHHNLVFNKVFSDDYLIEDTLHYQESVKNFVNFIKQQDLIFKTLDLNKLEICFLDNRYSFMIFMSVYTSLTLMMRVTYNANQSSGKRRMDYIKEDFVYNISAVITNVNKMQNKDVWVDDMVTVLKSCCQLLEKNTSKYYT